MSVFIKSQNPIAVETISVKSLHVWDYEGSLCKVIQSLPDYVIIR